MGDALVESVLYLCPVWRGARKPDESRERFVDPQPTRVSRATVLRLPFPSPPSTMMRCSQL